ncbi:MAG: hypothetical protein IKH65_01255 [Clostridia bacterium]|nr:hypothetical protein [Clostridia bacterium]
MKTHNEMFENVIARRDEYEVKHRQAVKRNIGLTAAALGLVLAVGIGAAYAKSDTRIGKTQGAESGKEETVNSISDENYGTDNPEYETSVADYSAEYDHEYSTSLSPEDESAIKEKEKIKSEATQTEEFILAGEYHTVKNDEKQTDTGATQISQIPDGDTGGNKAYSGATGYYKITPEIINGPAIKTEGTPITDREAEEYIKTNAKSLVQGIAFDSQYGGRGEYSICTKGYGHVSIDEKGTRTFKADFIDCPILRNGKIVGIVTLFRDDIDNSKIYSSVSYGGRYSALQKALDENPGEDLVFVYDGMAPEIIISKDNEMYFNPGHAEYVEGYDYYSAFRTEGNTFSSDDLKQCVTVTA